MPGIGGMIGALGANKKMFGIDVSHWQGNIDWAKVAQNVPKVDFAIIKTSTGIGSLDPRAVWNANGAKKNGIKVGYYHFCSLNDENELLDATNEAKWFMKVLKSLPTPDLPLVLDFENNPLVSLDKGELLTWIKTFFATLVANGYKDYILYSYKPFLDKYLPFTHGLGNIPLWIAQYRPMLSLPNGWTKHWLWQYSDRGRIKGIAGDVDLNKQ